MQPIGRDRSAVGLHLVLVGEPRGAERARLGPEASKVRSNAGTQRTEAATHRCAAGDRSCVDVELVRHDGEQPDAEQLVGEAVLLRRPGSQAELRSVLELDLGVGSVARDGDAGGGNGEEVPAAVVRGVQYVVCPDLRQAYRRHESPSPSRRGCAEAGVHLKLVAEVRLGGLRGGCHHGRVGRARRGERQGDPGARQAADRNCAGQSHRDAKWDSHDTH